MVRSFVEVDLPFSWGESEMRDSTNAFSGASNGLHSSLLSLVFAMAVVFQFEWDERDRC